MRITGGAWSGRRLSVPRGDVRPTADRVRESVFAILGDAGGRRVLDLCAGSGALGFEALSRGAPHCTFVDRSGAALSSIRASAERLEATDRIACVRGDVRAMLPRLARADGGFDLVLFDPPYAADWVADALAALAAGGILAPGAEVVVESDRRHPPDAREGLRVTGERRYGDTLVTFFEAGDTPGGDPAPTTGAEDPLAHD